MVNLASLLILTLLSSLLSTTTKNIENSFLENSPKKIFVLFSSASHLNISLPQPISFSDQLSNQQAYFLFQKIFFTYATFEFYSESSLPLYPEKDSYIFKARWSFRNKKNNNQYVFHIFFYLVNEIYQKSRASPDSPWKKHQSVREIWKITEIRAETF